MSTSSGSNFQRSYPLSPPPHSETKQIRDISCQQPHTPESPLHLVSTSADRSSPATEVGGNTLAKPSLTPTHSSKKVITSPADTEISMMDIHQSMSMDVEDASNKRKRELEDSGDRDQKKVHVEDRKLGIEDLHRDVGNKYLLCRTQHPRLLPVVTHDLFDLYSLNTIASSVARTLPNGDKNKLRKTYKGKIKELGISGKFDVTARDAEGPGGLLAMIRHPEEEWAMQNRQGKEIEKGLGQAVRANLPIAVTMSKGTVPKSQWDSSVLGELDLPESKASAAAPAVKPIASGMLQRGRGASAGPQGKGKADIARPKRNLKKRGYDESSFEGYGEGYVDDDMADAADPGYSTADGDDRGVAQKRRKKSNGYPGPPMRHNSYGPGMVGA